MAWSIALVIAPRTLGLARLRAGRTIAGVALSLALVATRQLFQALLAARNGTHVARLVWHLSVPAEARTGNELATEQVIAKVASALTNVSARQLCTTWPPARRWRCATLNRWIDAAFPASAEQRLVRHHSARRTPSEVAEILASVVPARQWLSAHLEAEVRLVMPIVESWATQCVAAMVSTTKPCPTDLLAQELSPLAA